MDNATKSSGSVMVYRAVVNNTDNTIRDSVVLTTNVPVGGKISESSVLPQSDNSCSFSTRDEGDVPTWLLGDISSGESKILVIPLSILAATAEATFYGAGSSDTKSIKSSVAISVSTSMSISPNHQVISSGAEVNYQATLGNMGKSGLADTELGVSIPSGSTLVSASDGGTQVTNNIVWDTGVLNGNDASKRYFALMVDSSAEGGEIFS